MKHISTKLFKKHAQSCFCELTLKLCEITVPQNTSMLSLPHYLQPHLSGLGSVHRMKPKVHPHGVEILIVIAMPTVSFSVCVMLTVTHPLFQPCRTTCTCTYYYLALSYLSAFRCLLVSWPQLRSPILSNS